MTLPRALLTLILLLAAGPLLAQGAPSSTGPTQRQLDTADTDPANWLTYNKGYLGYRFSSLAAIDRTNAARVKVLCEADLGFRGNMESGPLAYEGILYATAGLTTYAVDGATCASVWTYTYPAAKGAGATNRGLALAGGRLFRGTGDGHLLAIDAKTGALLWDQQVMDSTVGETASGAPLAWNGLVFIGKAGGDRGIQGEVMAFRQTDGGMVWGFHTVPNPGDMGSDTWPDAFSIAHGGGATWSAFSLDEARGLLLFPVGNPGPDNAKSLRPGENLFTNSIVALHATTGALSWWHQLLPGDDRDWDTSIVAAMPTAGGLDIAVAAGKDGVLHMVDRASGTPLLHPVPLVRDYLHTTTPVPMGNGLRLCPIAAVQWNGPSYSPRTNLVYMNGIDWCARVMQGPPPVYQVDKPYTGWVNSEAGLRDPISQAKGFVNAIDASTAALVWRTQTTALPLGGLIATGGGMVVTGEINGDVEFLEARTGEPVATVNVGQPIGGGLVAYVASGKQRLAVAAGLTSHDYGTSGSGTIAVLGIP